MKDFFSDYLEYASIDRSEAPVTFHRWAAVSIIAAILGRNSHLPFGHGKIHPNQYILIMGSPGARKSTAINIGTSLLKQIGFDRFSSDKTSKEKFLADMSAIDKTLDIDELELLTMDEPSETYIALGEFADFMGINNMEFVTTLTNLWDCPAEYKNPKITGKTVIVNKPCVNILGGSTPQAFSMSCPPESIGGGFLSRVLFIHGEPTGLKVTFPKRPDPLLEAIMVERLQEIKAKIRGVFTISTEAEELFEKIYNFDIDIDDNRFKHYQARRLDHLLKISMAMAASDLRMEILPIDALRANTMLHYAELKMPKALGEFGKSKYSDITNTVLDILNHSKKPVNINDLFRKTSQDVKNLSEMADIVKSLLQADKIQLISAVGNTGYMPKHSVQKQWDKSLLMEDWLTLQERK